MLRPRTSSQDRGSTTLETAILFPAVLLLLMVTIQAGLWYYGRSVALAAAQEGVAAGRVEGASAQEATQAAESFASTQGESLLSQTSISTRGSTPERIHVSVSGQVASLIPGVPISVGQEASGAVERWTDAP